MVLVIKVTMGQENRRVSVNDRTPTFSQLMELLESLFGPQTRECYVKYKDTEGDVVTIGSDIELKEAIDIADQTPSASKMLRLALVPKSLSASAFPSQIGASMIASGPPPSAAIAQSSVIPPPAPAPAAFDVTALLAVVSHLVNPDTLRVFANQFSDAAARLEGSAAATELKARAAKFYALAEEQAANLAINLETPETYMKKTQEVMRQLTNEIQVLVSQRTVPSLDLGQVLTAVSRMSSALSSSVMMPSPFSSAPSTPVKSGPTVHNNVTCDGCGSFPLVGIRYKCVQCDNYDLCAGCKRANVHAATSHTFKATGTDGVQPAPSVASPAASHVLSASMRPTYLMDLIVSKLKSSAPAAAPIPAPSSSSSAPAPASPAPVSVSSKPESSAPAAIASPASQNLLPSSPVAPILASSPVIFTLPQPSSPPPAVIQPSQVQPLPQVQTLPAAVAQPIPSSAQPLQVPSNPALNWASLSQNGLGMSSSAVPNGNPSSESPFNAAFVMDLSLPDGTQLAPSRTHPDGSTTLNTATKKWRFQNNGQLAWPAGTSLAFVGGDRLATIETVLVASSPIASGENVDVSVDLTVPSKPGRFISYWRLMTPEGIRFGHRVWIDIVVDDKFDAPVQAPKPSPVIDIPIPSAPADVQQPSAPVESEQYAEQMSALREMGFVDDKMNRTFLAANNGDLTRTVQEILAHL